MNMIKKIRVALTLMLVAALTYCGSNGTTTTLPFNNTGLLTGLYVVSSTPAHNQFYVATSTTSITIRMSMPVDGDTATSSNIQLINKTTGATVPMTPSTDESEIITLSGFTLALNQDYQIRLYPGLASTCVGEGCVGTALLEGQAFEYFYIDFSTGSGGGAGISIPGVGPKVISSEPTTTTPGCQASILITFTESLAYAPAVTLEYFNPFSKTVIAYAYPALLFDNAHWQVDLCVGDRIPGTNVWVHMENSGFVDLEGMIGEEGVDGYDHAILFP